MFLSANLEIHFYLEDSDRCKLFVGNITYNVRFNNISFLSNFFLLKTGKKELEELFGKYGTVKEARIAGV
jgi:RNA recognition motif-containing protein